MPYTFAVARHTAQKIREARDFLEVPICVENVSSYAEYHASQMTEWEFLSEVVELADCGILLMLVEVATNGLEPTHITAPLRTSLKRIDGFRKSVPRRKIYSSCPSERTIPILCPC
jgi:uncharacterized protein (UPF0276 family)